MNLDTKSLFEGMKESLGPDFFEELNKELDEACAKSNADMRQREIALDKFIAEGERNTDKMDSVINQLYFLVDVPLAEKIIRKYIAYLATFNPTYAQNRLDVLEETFGYKSVIVYAAGLMAHSFGSLRNGCDENCRSFQKLLRFTKEAHNWKEKVALFIHDASRNSECSIPELMNILNDTTMQLMNTPEQQWWQSWMVDLMDNDAETTHPITEAEANEITCLIQCHCQNCHQ